MTCPPHETIAAASRIMALQGVGSVIVTAPTGEPEGIVTDRDLRQRALAAGRSPTDPVVTIMTTPLVTISPEAFVFEALLEMTRRNIHHLPVIEGRRLIGVLSSHDLLLLQAAAPLVLARTIHSPSSLEELTTIMPALREATRQLFEEGLSGYELGRVIAELNDLVLRRVLEFVERDFRDGGVGEPPVSFCWLALGSEGRREQTIATDQDNALVYADVAASRAQGVQRYFDAFAERVIHDLIRLGYPSCPADAMASNPKWCKPLAVWRDYFAEWVRDPVPENLLNSAIYFDFRPVAGSPELARALRNAIHAQIQTWRSFPRHLATLAVSHAPPVGLFGRWRVVREGGRCGINMKLQGLLLLVNALRAYAVDLGLEETNTIERLEAAARVGRCFTPMETDDVREAYETIFRLRLRHQLSRLANGAVPDNLLDPYGLSPSDQARLKDAFRAIRRLQGKVADRYFTEPLV